MSTPFKHWIKQYLYFSKKDRNAIIILSSFILIMIIGIFIIDNIQLKSQYDYTEFEKALEEWENSKTKSEISNQTLFAFNPNSISEQKLDSLLIPDFVKRNIVNYRKAGGRFASPSDFRKIYGMNDSIFVAIEKYIEIPSKSYVKTKPINIPEKAIPDFFDPNQASFQELTKLGFNRFQANNIIEYRKKGGEFGTETDLLKIYGIDSAFFMTIEKYIQIKILSPTTPAEVNPSPLLIELNSADSLELVILSGIGPVFASRILKYRDLLGGFYSKSQLLEVYNFSEETYSNIENYILVDTIHLKKIRINFTDYGELLRHPYLNNNQVKSLLDYREKNGAFSSIKQIHQANLVDSITFSKIEPYLNCR